MTSEERHDVRELSLDEAVALAIGWHRGGELENAEKIYRRVLEVRPEHPDALHFLGVLRHQQGDSEGGIALIRRSLALTPGDANRHNNLGNALLESGALEDATLAYERALAIEPAHADAYNNLGALLKAQGRYEEAFAAFGRALQADPNHADAYNNLGNLFAAQGRVREAVAYYCKALTLHPGQPEARRLLGIAYSRLGQIEQAAAVFGEWLQEEPNNPIARHLFAACSGREVPERASDAYVETSFDSFAETFDSKLQKLAYRAPALVADALAAAGVAADKSLAVIDAGCGTGLCGALLAPYASRLTGVDLSAGMLAQARARGVYDELVKAELTAYLASLRGAVDVVVSADTLVYFGALEAVLRAASGALRANGLLVFTVEAARELDEPPGYRINPHGRYSHGEAYLRSALSDAGFEVLAIERAVLRSEGGEPVEGFVVSARRTVEPALP